MENSSFQRSSFTGAGQLHKLRRALLRPAPEPLSAMIQLDEGLVGGKGGDKSMALFGVEVGGRVRLAHADNNEEGTIKSFAEAQVAKTASVVTDGKTKPCRLFQPASAMLT